MKVEVWKSFSCNNSSSYYLVARFGTAAAAGTAAKELEAFFAAHGEQSDQMWEDGADPISTPTEAATALAAKHGFEWTGYLAWGDEGMSYDQPNLRVLENDVFLYHDYCGGFGDGVPKYFAAVGAEVGKETRGNPLLSVVFAIPESADGKAASEAVWAFIVGLRECAELEEGWAFAGREPGPPWDDAVLEDMEFECGVPYPAFRDERTIGFVIEVPNLREWDTIGDWFAGSGISDYRIEIDRPGAIERLRTIATAVCPECKKGPMQFIEAGRSEVPDDQLACRGCGGMFALAAFLPS